MNYPKIKSSLAARKQLGAVRLPFPWSCSPISRLVVVKLAMLAIGFGLLIEADSATTHGQAPQSPSTSVPSDDSILPGIIRLETLPGNTDKPVVTAMELSHDSKFLVAAGDDHGVRLLELGSLHGESARASFAARLTNLPVSYTAENPAVDSAKELQPKSRHTWRSHADWVRSVRFSPSDRLVASCGNDGKVVVYDVNTKTVVASIQVPHALQDLCFIDDTTIYTIGFNANVYRWDLSQSQPVIDHQADCPDLRTIQYSPALSMLAYGGRDGVLRLYRMSDGKCELYSLAPAHFRRIRSLQFLDDHRTLLSVGDDRRLIQYDISSKAITSTLEIPGGKLFGLTAIDSNHLAIGGADNTIRILDAKTCQCTAKLIGHDGTVTLLNTRGNVLISSSFDTTIRIWNVERAYRECDSQKRYHHPVSAQFESSGALDKPGILVSKPVQ